MTIARIVRNHGVAIAGGGGGSPIASGAEYLHVDFTNLANGASITSKITTWGAQGTGAFAGGTSGCYGDTSVKRTGKSSSCRMSILAGSTGRPGDGADAQEGDFGFIRSFPANVVDGGDIRVGEWCFFPVGFDVSTSSGFLKTHRFDQNGSGRMELEIVGGLLFGLSPGSTQFGWAALNEAYSQLQSETVHRSDTILTLGSWHWFEQYIHVTATAANAIRRVWVDEVMVLEQVGGSSVRWRNQSGAYITSSFASPVATLPNSGSYIPNVYEHTYWNGGASQNQSRYCSNLVISNNNETATDLVLDAEGNKMIGMNHV